LTEHFETQIRLSMRINNDRENRTLNLMIKSQVSFLHVIHLDSWSWSKICYLCIDVFLWIWSC